MNLFYLRTLLIMLVAWAVANDYVYAQPNGNYGPKNANYSVPSGAYFASPNGKGGTPCTRGNPCSLEKALSSAPSGTTIVLLGGTYRTSDYNTRIPRKLTLQPHPGANVILKGSKVATNWRSDRGDWKTSWKRLYPAKYNRKKSNVVTNENPMAAHQDMVFVNGNPLKQVASRNKVKSGTFYVDYRSKSIYIGTNPGGKRVEITASGWGLHTHGVNASGITIRGLKFMHYAETGIMLSSPGAVIENNEFTDNAVAGIKMYGAKRASVKNNRFSENGLQGVGANQADHLLFENNIVTNNNTEKFNRNSWSAAGAKILLSPSSMIRNNLFKDNDANGLWLDNRSNNSAIVNNMVKNNTRNGVHCEISSGVVIAGNIVTNCGNNSLKLIGSGVMVANSANAKVYNNTLVKNYINLQIADIKRGSDKITRNVIVKNNILSDAAVNKYPSSQMWVRLLKCGDVVVKELDYNAYHKSSSKQADLLLRWKVASNCNKEERHGAVASMARSLGFGKNSMAFTGSDPFFENRSSDNYKLKRNSKALKAGEALPADVKKALGWGKSGKVDLGAYQSGYTAAPSALSASSAPKSGNLPWKENFNASNGKYKGSVERKNLYDNAILKIKNGRLRARGVGEAAWKSDVINLNGKTVNFSMELSSKGNLESGYDNIKVYYRLNNGNEKLAAVEKGNIKGSKKVVVKGVKGKSLQIVVRFKNSDISEHYFLDDVNVEVAGSNGRFAKTDKSKEEGEESKTMESEEIAMIESGVDVYPNPVESFLEVKVNSMEGYDATLVLLDMTGKKVSETTQVRTNEQVSLDLSNLQRGVYILQIIDEQGGTQTERILKQ